MRMGNTVIPVGRARFDSDHLVRLSAADLFPRQLDPELAEIDILQFDRPGSDAEFSLLQVQRDFSTRSGSPSRRGTSGMLTMHRPLARISSTRPSGFSILTSHALNLAGVDVSVSTTTLPLTLDET